jgi:aryl-alcohol dehydrogenase-like predicted oxidoreductase
VLDGGKRVVVTAERIRREVDESLKTLGTDHVDVLLLHRDDTAHPVAEYVETLEALRREGKCLAYGGSNWRHERLAEANAYAAAHGYPGMTLSSPHYGLAEQVQDPWGGECITATGTAMESARAWYRETRMPLLAYSSLGRGFFSGAFKSSDIEGAKKVLDEVAQRGYLCDANLKRLARAEEIAAAHGVAVATVAMAYLLTDPMNTLAVVSMPFPELVQANLKVFDFEFAPGERESLAAI